MITEKEAMLRAIDLGEQGRVTAPPNPWVGCVIVKDGVIIGEGYHHKAGGPHAEVIALQQAGKQAEGATVYNTLEPCSHYGRTPPCVDALIKAQVQHVVIAVKDPDPKVSGRGIEQLQHAGITITTGICSEEATKSLTPYLHHRMTGRPYCVAKAAISVDGRIAAKDGSSQWISTEAARTDAHRLRAESQAILVGSGTALVDTPSLTVRNTEVRPPQPPIRVVLDSTGKLSTQSPLFDTSLAPTLIFTTGLSPEAVRNAWKAAGAEVELMDRVNLGDVFDILGKRGVIQVLAEGGGILHGSLLQEKLINQLTLYVGPRILGDAGKPLFQNTPFESIDLAPSIQLKEVKQLGDTIRLDYLA